MTHRHLIPVAGSVDIVLHYPLRYGPDPEQYEQPYVTITHQVERLAFSLDLSSEEAVAFGTWLIQQAPHMASVPGSGGLDEPTVSGGDEEPF